MNAEPTSPDDSIGVYLDTCVVIEIGEAMNGDWAPGSPPSDHDKRLLSSARLALYGHHDRNRWLLFTSTEARDEGLRGPGLEWLEAKLSEIDLMGGAPPDSMIGELVERYEAVGIDPADARHVAQCASRPYFRYFVTSDRKILSRGPEVRLDHELTFLSPTDAEPLLCISAGEEPGVRPADSHPLAHGPNWWIPSEEDDLA